MSRFKLLAIRPLLGCDKRHLKNLREGQLYKFYNNYDFTQNKDQDVEFIEKRSTTPANLFGENISVSAIVGKNGSGKSTIIELFNLLIFNLSVHLKLINIDEFKVSHSLSSDDVKRLDDELLSFKQLKCEIYYLIGDSIYCIRKDLYSIKLSCFKKEVEDTKYLLAEKESFAFPTNMDYNDKNIFLNNSFFYSIVANYSLYGLNTNETGIWLKSLFHKNDGYQTPLVLNPMRTEGIIDINRLTYLSKSRLLFNVFKPLEDGQKEENSLRNLVNNKIVNKVILNLILQNSV